MKFLIISFMLASFVSFGNFAQAYEVEPVGGCYVDSKCRKPLTDQMVTATQCGRLARMSRHRRAYLWADFRNNEGRVVSMCGLIYNTIVPPEDPSRVIHIETCPIMLPGCR